MVGPRVWNDDLSISDASVAIRGSCRVMLLLLDLSVEGILWTPSLPVICLSTSEASLFLYRWCLAVHCGFLLIRALVILWLSPASASTSSRLGFLFFLWKIGFSSASKLKVPASTSSSTSASTSTLGGNGGFPGFGDFQSIQPLTDGVEIALIEFSMGRGCLDHREWGDSS